MKIIRDENRKEIWSFFSGAMGLDLGFEREGLHPTLALEYDKWCCETIRLNRPSITLIEGKIEEFKGLDLYRARQHEGDVYLIIGGPPCQAFSSGGKRAGLNDQRGNLIYEYIRMISEIRPQYFVFENVANLVTAALRHRKIKDRPGQHWSLKTYETKKFYSDDGVVDLDDDEKSGSAIRQILNDFGSLGYATTFGVLDAADYGAAQHRLRFVMIGARDGAPPPLPKPLYGTSKYGLPQYKTLREVISDLVENPGLHSEYTEDQAFFFRHVPAGGNWRNLPENLKQKALGGAWLSGGGKTGFFRRLSWDSPSPTIIGRANRKASALCHPDQTRPLSVKECARLQGFSDDWFFSGSMSQQYLQIGNAVPINLAAAVAKQVRKFAAIDGESIRNHGHTYETEFMLEQAVKRLRSSAKNKRSTIEQTSFL